MGSANHPHGKGGQRKPMQVSIVLYRLRDSDEATEAEGLLKSHGIVFRRQYRPAFPNFPHLQRQLLKPLLVVRGSGSFQGLAEIRQHLRGSESHTD